MPLTNEEMDRILEDFRPILENDEQLVAVDVEHDEDGENPTIYLRHLNPSRSTYQEQSYNLLRSGTTLTIPIVVVKSDEVLLELAGPDEKSVFDEMSDVAHLVGMAGTKIARSSGSWGTLCLSGRNVRVKFGEKTCEVNGPFVFTNSHVARRLGNRLISFGRTVGKVNCLYNLNARRAFDYGQAPWTENLAEQNFFRVYDSGGPNKVIRGLQAITVNARIGKQGAKTGWTTGRATGKSLTRVRGYDGLFPSWKGTYGSDSGDSGSPIIREVNGRWYHVGIHFSSGPRFQSWDDARIVATS
jgi:hypothetical protein